MDLAKKERSVARRLFTKYANELEAILQHEKTDVEWHILHQKLDEMRINLKRLDSKIKETILVNFEEDELEKEMEDAMRYQTKWLRLHALYNEKISTEEARTENSKDSTLKMSHIHRNYKLPKLQLTTFDGELKNWLAFWGQFSKIHNDTTMDDVDKHQYLIQSMKEYTEVRSLVESFPPTAYEDCISQIKARYAREELLIQVYVREILALVLMKKETTLTQLYDKLNANLRALDALGVTKDKYAAFLLPMVESAMSQELLRTWERTRISISKDVAEELACLLEFLKKEVDGEQRIKITRETFQTETTDMKRSSNIPTAECLLSNAQKTQPKKLNTCIWCEKETHSSLECYKGLKMTIEQRRAYLKDKKACAICLRKGHHPKVCRASVKCLRCGKRHSTLLCQEDTVHSEETSKAATLSTMYPRGETLLQTVIVEIECNNKKLPVRALFDSGSQRTYIKQEVVDNLKIPPCGKEVLAHSLFGGVETRPKEYNVYDVKLKSTVSSFNMNVMAISQSQICGNVPKRNPSDIQLNKLLCDHNITLTDREGHRYRDVDWGRLFRISVDRYNDTAARGTGGNKYKTGLDTAGNSGYWALETLGIQDPVEVKTKLETATEIMTNFETTIAEQDDRYVVQLPFKSNYQDLHPNYGKAKMRLEVMSKRLVSSGRFEQYDSILKNWENLGVIEKVKPTHDTGHFLPHRPVMKEQSLTCAMRPVFDASATDKNGLSLNACLEKGINLIDCIPNLIHSFRKGAIGITSDIEKAFLQISLKEQDRDFLKFLWYQDNTMKEIITYRHCRVVFGLTSSPFLLSATLRHHISKMKNGPLGSTAETLEKSLYVDNCLVSVNTEEEANRFIEEEEDYACS